MHNLSDAELRRKTIDHINESKDEAARILLRLHEDAPWSGEPLPDILRRICRALDKEGCAK